MGTYYSGKRAASYNRTWKTFSEKTLAAACSAIDLAQLRTTASTLERHPRLLDVACGTGLLLARLAQLAPDAELYGVDESQDMLREALPLIEKHPHLHLDQARLHGGELAGLPYPPASFDLITCTNSIHYLTDPIGVLRGLASLLAPQGQMVIEDYARRTFPFPWQVFEWFVRRVDRQHVRAYTLTEAQSLCQAAGLQVMVTSSFAVDLLWQGWVIRAGTKKRGNMSFIW